MRVSALARHGFWLPLPFLAAGTAMPWFGELALHGMAVWAVSLVLFGLLAMSPGRIGRSDIGPTLSLALAASLLAPLLVHALGNVLQLPPNLRLVMVAIAAAPIAQSAGTFAAMLKLPDRGATLAALATVLAAPAILPAAVAVLADADGSVPAGPLAARTAMLALSPAVLAFVLRRSFPGPVAALRLDFRGLVILALCMVAAARGPGILDSLEAPWHALHLGVLACLVTACGMAVGWLLAVPFGRSVALAAMYANGARNITFAWAAVVPLLDADGTLFITLMVIPFNLLPLVMKQIVPVLTLAAHPPMPRRNGMCAESHPGRLRSPKPGVSCQPETPP